MVRTQDQIRGGLLGAAAGDALGYCVQELSLEEIHERFGPEGIRGYDTENGYALISANTQLALFTAGGLLYGQTRGALRGMMGPSIGYLKLAYGDWMRTQTYGGKRAPGKYTSWLCGIDDIYARRTPDKTTMMAFATERLGTMEDPLNRSKAAAALPRTLTTGLFLNQEGKAQEAARLGAETAAMTHGDPLGFLPSAYLAELINRLLVRRAGSFRSILHDTIASVQEQFGREYPKVREIAALLAQAELLAGDEISPEEAMVELNPVEAHRVLAAACYTCLKFPGDFEGTLVAAVNHSGDSAAVGCVAGALMGTAVGTEGIPEFYIDPLELRDVLEEMADDLFQGCPMCKGNRLFDDRWNDKYVQCVY